MDICLEIMTALDYMSLQFMIMKTHSYSHLILWINYQFGENTQNHQNTKNHTRSIISKRFLKNSKASALGVKAGFGVTKGCWGDPLGRRLGTALCLPKLLLASSTTDKPNQCNSNQWEEPMVLRKNIFKRGNTGENTTVKGLWLVEESLLEQWLRNEEQQKERNHHTWCPYLLCCHHWRDWAMCAMGGLETAKQEREHPKGNQRLFL